MAGNALDISKGGTSQVTAAGARIALGLEIGVDVQAWDSDLDIVSDFGTYGITFNTVSALTAATIPAAVTTVQTLGYYSVGDGGAAAYHRNPSATLYESSADGTRWQVISDDCLIANQYGAKGDSIFDNASILQAVLNLAGITGRRVKLKAGTYLTTANLLPPVGAGTTCVDIDGEGWQNTTIKFSGAAVTKGLYYSGVSGYQYCGALRDIRIFGAAGALRGITGEHLNHPFMERVIVSTFLGSGIHLENVLMAEISHCLIGNCGSATEGQITADTCTTFKWDQTRISGSQALAVCGLMIDDVATVNIISGAIETTQIPIKISSKAGRTVGVTCIEIIGVDLENPQSGDRYIEVGNGWNGSANLAVRQMRIESCLGVTSGATQITNAIWLKNTTSVTISNNYMLCIGTPTSAIRMEACLSTTISDGNLFFLPGTPTAVFELIGSGNASTYIAAHPGMYGASYPWVIENSIHRTDATPQQEFNQNQTGDGAVSTTQLNGVNPSVLFLPAQGGYYRTYQPNNAVPTNLTTITGGRVGMRITLIATNGNTTLIHGTSTDELRLRAGVNYTMIANTPAEFYHNGTGWVEIGLANQLPTVNVNGTLTTTGSVGIVQGTPLASLHVGAGTDTPFITGAAGTTIYATNAGSTNIAVRDSSSNIEGLYGAFSGTSSVIYGSGTNHAVSIRTNNVDRLSFTAAGAATFAGSLTASSGGSLAGTWTSLGTVTTVDINGGTADAVVIGGATPAAATVTTLAITQGAIISGVWTPTDSANVNLDAATASEGQYIRVGSTVTCSVSVTVDPTAAASTSFELSLPVASNIGAASDCIGTGSSGTLATGGEPGFVRGNVANNTAEVAFIATSTASHDYYLHFTYQVI